MIGKRKGQTLVIGGESRVDLLPPEIRLKQKTKVLHHRQRFVLFLVALVMIGGIVLVRAQALAAEANLSTEEMSMRIHLLQARKYLEVQKVMEEIETIQAAQQVGTSTEIDWERYLTSVRATLPLNVTLDTISIDSATPFAPYPQSSAPLQGARIATLSFTAKSPTLPKVPAWLIALTSLHGYVDASPNSVTRSESGAYFVSITMHINEAAFTNRFSVAAGK